MTIEEIRELKRANPFRPFVLGLKDGERVVITRPELIALSPTGKSVVVSEGNRGPLLPLSEIASVRTLKPKRNLSASQRSRTVGRVTYKEIHELYSATPFEPFELVLTNGAKILVDHPEFMSFKRDRRTVYVHDLDDRTTRIDIKMIVALNEMANGARPRKRKK
ncbi:MAG TPA: hypothetical protein VG095_08415 [Chthoniobacterales bacterium]|nr:hypothetical protein [Chthoniobacterales bacterium]